MSTNNFTPTQNKIEGDVDNKNSVTKKESNQSLARL